MNIHATALLAFLAFLAFHVIVTGGGLMFDQVLQVLGQGANENDTLLVGEVGMACMSRAALKLG